MLALIKVIESKYLRLPLHRCCPRWCVFPASSAFILDFQHLQLLVFSFHFHCCPKNIKMILSNIEKTVGYDMITGVNHIIFKCPVNLRKDKLFFLYWGHTIEESFFSISPDISKQILANNQPINIIGLVRKCRCHFASSKIIQTIVKIIALVIISVIICKIVIKFRLFKQSHGDFLCSPTQKTNKRSWSNRHENWYLR